MQRNLLTVITATLAAAAIILSGISLSSGASVKNLAQETSTSLQDVQAKLTPAANTFPAAATDAIKISANPTQIPAALDRPAGQHVKIELETVEVDGQLADGATYTYWTFNKQVPGPFLRVKQGDTVELTLKNAATSKNVHSIDLHAVTGTGGGAVGTSVKAGEAKTITFQALNQGLYVYHCASPHIPSHIAEGMYGLILVEPAPGLPKVDREFYLMQGEIYAAGTHGDKGHQPFDGDKLLHEDPNFVVFNGAFQALAGEGAMKAKVGETIRLFVGNGGPNLISSFHVIGEIFDAVHDQGATEAMHDVQTTLIPAGGAAWVEFKVDVLGRYTLVDHAISRAIDKGAIAQLVVEGQADPTIYNPGGNLNMAGH